MSSVAPQQPAESARTPLTAPGTVLLPARLGGRGGLLVRPPIVAAVAHVGWLLCPARPSVGRSRT